MQNFQFVVLAHNMVLDRYTCYSSDDHRVKSIEGQVTEAGTSGSDLVSSTAPAKAFERTEGFFVLLTKNRSAWDLKKP